MNFKITNLKMCPNAENYYIQLVDDFKIEPSEDTVKITGHLNVTRPIDDSLEVNMVKVYLLCVCLQVRVCIHIAKCLNLITNNFY